MEWTSTVTLLVWDLFDIILVKILEAARLAVNSFYCTVVQCVHVVVISNAVEETKKYALSWFF